MKKNLMTFKEISKYCNEIQKFKVECKCGHRVMIPFGKDFKICNWCGHKVYRNKNLEFKERLKQILKNED